MRLLVAECDSTSYKAFEVLVGRSGVQIQATHLIEDAFDLVHGDYDLLVTGLEFPDGTGIGLISRIRAAALAMPIIVVSGRVDVGVKVNALVAGADDYITWPCHKDELFARINAVVRRAKGHASSVVQVDGLLIDLVRRNVMLDGKHVHLTRKEYGILEILAMRQGSVVSVETLLNHLYSHADDTPVANIVNVYVGRIRSKLGRHSGKNYIETIWAAGFSLRASAEQDTTKNQFARLPPVSRRLATQAAE